MAIVKITVDVEEDDARSIDQEAADRAMARSPYCAQIIRQRHQKDIVLKVNDEKLIGRLEGKIEALTEQNADLTSRLATTAEAAGIGSVEQTGKVTTKTIQEAVDKAKKEWQNELDQKELADLRKRDGESAKRIKDLEAELAGRDNWHKAMEIGGTVASKIAETNPALVNRLGGMLGLGELADAPISPQDAQALEYGRLILQNVPADIRPDLMLLVAHVAEHPQSMPLIMNVRPLAALKAQSANS